MWRTMLAGMRAYRARLMMAALATVIGAAFVVGTLILGDTLKADTERAVTANTAKVDVAVLAPGGLRPLPRSALEELEALDGVAGAQGAVQGTATLLGRDGRPLRTEPAAVSATVRTSIAEGRAPEADGEAALAEQTARNAGFAVGDRIGVLDAEGRERKVTVTGLVDTQGEGDLALQGAAVFTERTAREVTGRDGYAGIYLDAAPGTAPEELRDRAAAALGDGGNEVLTGRQWAEMKAQGSGIDPALLATGLLLLSLVALLVAGLVIQNTFGVLIAQRTRELALLRCVGASRGQVFGRVLAESAAVGAAASALGAVLGVAAGYGAIPVFHAFGNDIPYSMVTVAPLSLVLGFGAGLLVTVAAAVPPAHAATRVPPIAALNGTEERASGPIGPVRVAAGAAACALGTAVAAAGAVVIGGGPPALTLVVCGGMLFFLGVVALGPALIGPAVRLVGFLPGRLLGTPGRLAVANARRSPRRASATAVALAVGVTLMTGVSVVIESFSESAAVGVEKAVPVDYVITAPGGGRGEQIPASVVDRLRAADGVTEVAGQREALVELDGRDASIAHLAAGGPIDQAEVVDGAPLDELGADRLAVSADRAEEFGLEAGDKVQVRTGGDAFELEVGSIVRGEPFPPFSMSEQGHVSRFGDRGYGAVMLDVSPDLAPEEARAIVEEATEEFPTASITGTDDARAQLEGTLSDFVMVITGLLGLAVLVSLVGIANMMSLSVIERSRESALLRALGLSRRRLGRMLTVEALVLGAVGACIGVLLGVSFGLAAVSVIREDLVMVVPYGRIALIVAAAAAAAMAAALLPARRAGRTSITASLAAE
ncbi:ABC transporter permease [Nocardiopsis sp. CNT-189]|uniref:ABC transporter permease n=1 Tax=Nocardiopsis oceanisediminis TaxID=2816862 RepID=UPI003B3B611B